MTGRKARRAYLALLVASLLAIVLSPHLTDAPDGLEAVAERLGFARASESAPGWTGAPAPDYAAPGLGDSSAATVVAGIAGATVVGLVALAAGRLLTRRRNGPRGRPGAGP